MHVLISTSTCTNYSKNRFPMRVLLFKCLFENRCLSSEDLFLKKKEDPFGSDFSINLWGTLYWGFSMLGLCAADC